MKIINNIATDIPFDYATSLLSNPAEALFLDIETTGFTATSSDLYLIGCAYFQDNRWYIRQFFSEDSSHQEEILRAFLDFAKPYRTLIHFNGKTFDLPYLEKKCRQYNIPWSLSTKETIDLYQIISPYKKLFGISNCKQKTLEQWLGIDREDPYNGGELIEIYLEYSSEYDQNAEKTLLLHNQNDMEGMLSLVSLLTYHQFISNIPDVTSYRIQTYEDMNGNSGKELILEATLSQAFPKTVSLNGPGCYLRLSERKAFLRVPVFSGTLKYFYPNPKEYYYLPTEDRAIHKSVASFVDKDFRVKATSENCYIRKESTFLPQWSELISPCFRESSNQTQLYFEFLEESEYDPALLSRYFHHVTEYLIHLK